MRVNNAEIGDDNTPSSRSGTLGRLWWMKVVCTIKLIITRYILLKWKKFWTVSWLPVKAFDGATNHIGMSSQLSSTRLVSLLLLNYSVKSSITQEQRLATPQKLVTRLHQPRAIIVRLQAHKTDVVILTPETVGSDSMWAVANPGL